MRVASRDARRRAMHACFVASGALVESEWVPGRLRCLPAYVDASVQCAGTSWVHAPPREGGVERWPEAHAHTLHFAVFGIPSLAHPHLSPSPARHPTSVPPALPPPPPAQTFAPGARYLLCLASLMWAVSTAMTPLAPLFELQCLLRCVNGAALSGVMPITQVLFFCLPSIWTAI